MRIPSKSPARAASLAIAAIALAVIATALVFEHAFGYAPCPLCLEQRWPYYIGIPSAFLAAARPLPPRLLIAVLLALSVLFAWGLYLGVYQAGAEWRFWQGPADCSAGGNATTTPADVGGLIGAIEGSTVVSCTDPSLRILGVSLAGWNAVVMAFLILLALGGALSQARRLKSR
jgi:disulfide bond formation protein DsbB